VMFVITYMAYVSENQVNTNSILGMERSVLMAGVVGIKIVILLCVIFRHLLLPLLGNCLKIVC